MKKVIKALIIASLLLLSLCHYAGADTWEDFVDERFGESSNDYAWSMAAFREKLYAGAHNSNRGAEIRSSSSGEPDTWQRVYNTLRSSAMVKYPNTSGVEYTNNILIGEFAVFNNPDAPPIPSENAQLPQALTEQRSPSPLSSNQHLASIKVADWNQFIQQRLSDAQSKNI